MIIPYTEACGVARACKEIAQFLESQEEVVKNIKKRHEENVDIAL